ncbi:hypothetical protein ACIRBX_11870 [Kitasatospora sp. NPDC096147]|uniref:hypothetical protein n=1 Tax=Kitasatospora sp. NPDC096147 TaxID=3364093 RepID=UPI003824F598
MTMTHGYTIEKEMVDLVPGRTGVSAKELEEAGGGVVALVVRVTGRHGISLRSLAKDLARSTGRGINTVALSVQEPGGIEEWKAVPVERLVALTKELADLRDQLRVESAVRARG